MPEMADVVIPGSPGRSARGPEERVEGTVKRGKEMFVDPEALREFEALLKNKRNIKTGVTNKIRVAEQGLAESSQECPERLATAAAIYFKGMLDLNVKGY